MLLSSEVEHEEDSGGVAAADYSGAIREALRYADQGIWDGKIMLPTGRRTTVAKLLRRLGLLHLVNYGPEDARD